MTKRINFFLSLGSFLCVLITQAQTNFNLSSESKLTVDGTSTVHDWTVTANTLQGELKTDGKAPQKINFQVVVADMKSERGETMDIKMHNALAKDEHPKVIFELYKVKNEQVLVGALTIAGKTQNVEIDCKIVPSKDTFKIEGQKKIILKDYDIEPPTAMFGQVVVGNDVVVKFDLVFKASN